MGFFLLLFFAFIKHHLSHYTALETFLAVLQAARHNPQELALEVWTVFDYHLRVLLKEVVKETMQYLDLIQISISFKT